MIILYGDSAKRRFKYRKFSDWGPFLTIGNKNTLNTIIISWKNQNGNSNDTLKIIDPVKHDLIIQRIVLPTIDYYKVKGMNYFEILNINPNITYRYKLCERNEIFTIKSKINLKIGDSTHNDNSIGNSVSKKNEEFKIIAIGDLHAGGNSVEDLASHILEKHFDSDIFLTLGDLLSDTQMISHWRTFFGQFKDILAKVPFIYLLGNHDGISINGYKLWKSMLRQPYYDDQCGGFFSIDVLSTHIVMLDNYNDLKKHFYFSSKQIDWLKTDLEKVESEKKY